jgi:hypothetical protein
MVRIEGWNKSDGMNDERLCDGITPLSTQKSVECDVYLSPIIMT